MLESSASAGLRAACARALGSGARGLNDRKLLLRTLEHDSDSRVRAAGAAALEDFAAGDATVRERLMQILQSTDSTELRAGAARGLGRAAIRSPSISDTLLQIESLQDVPEELQLACAWALVDQIGQNTKVTDEIKSWLDLNRTPELQRIAAQVMAEAMGEETLPWDPHVVERIEHVLMTLDKPCSHALASLEALATARALRRGLRLENVLRDALKPLGDRIEVAFVFGSTARNRQTEESDIDLLLIGEVKLKDLSTPLRTGEKTLGRRISPVIYTRAAFVQKYRSGDPFLMDVCRREKISLLGPRNSSLQEDLNDELRAMVAEQMASA